MQDGDPTQFGQLPPEMLQFTLLNTTTALAPRLGRLSLPGRKTLLTPQYIGNTSRGVVPHITQDNFHRHTDIGGVYVGLEDCGCIIQFKHLLIEHPLISFQL